MRILFAFIGGAGHFYPLVPTAKAAEAAGHAVAFACSGRMVGTVTSAGFRAVPTDDARNEPPPRRPLARPDPAREEHDVREAFVRRGARHDAEAVLTLAREWRPDVVVRDEMCLGAALAAEVLDIPCANVVVLAAGGLLRPDVVAEPLHELRAAYGLAADPELRMLHGECVLAPFPACFRGPRFPLPPTTHWFRQGLRLRRASRAGARTVYFTLGTSFNAESGDLFARVLTGLREIPANVVVTVGEHLDPAELGPQPENVRVERFVPQAELLPRCDVLVSHGGSGGVLAALAHGVPSVLLPLGADQPHNARRCVALGVARELDPMAATPSDVRDAVSAVLTDESYREAAERLRAANNALPGPESVLVRLEALAHASAR